MGGAVMVVWETCEVISQGLYFNLHYGMAGG